MNKPYISPSPATPSERTYVWNAFVDPLLFALTAGGVVMYLFAALLGLLSEPQKHLEVSVVHPIMRLFFWDTILNGLAMLIAVPYYQHLAADTTAAWESSLLAGATALFALVSGLFFHHYSTATRLAAGMDGIILLSFLQLMGGLFGYTVGWMQQRKDIPRTLLLTFMAHTGMAFASIPLALVLCGRLGLFHF